MLQAVTPNSVLSPRKWVSHLSVAFDGGLYNGDDPWGGWSVSRLLWDKAPAG